MLALTVKQPWADSIARGMKTIENRTWAPPERIIGQDVAIHAGAKHDEERLELYRAMAGDEARPVGHMPLGGIVAIVRVVGALNIETGETVGEVDVEAVRESRWVVGPWAWVLDSVRSVASPPPCRGQQGLWLLPRVMERALAHKGITRKPPRNVDGR